MEKTYKYFNRICTKNLLQIFYKTSMRGFLENQVMSYASFTIAAKAESINNLRLSLTILSRRDAYKIQIKIQEINLKFQ